MATKKLEKLATELEEEQRKQEEERYWCPYCGHPLRLEQDYLRGWTFHSPKGGAYFQAKIFKCSKCKKKVRVTKQEPGLAIKEE